MSDDVAKLLLSFHKNAKEHLSKIDAGLREVEAELAKREPPKPKKTLTEIVEEWKQRYNNGGGQFALDCIINIEEYIEAYHESDDDGWEPIKTAPKDGTFLDLWGSVSPSALVSRWPDMLWSPHTQSWTNGITLYPDANFTHWRRRPKQPRGT